MSGVHFVVVRSEVKVEGHFEVVVWSEEYPAVFQGWGVVDTFLWFS